VITRREKATAEELAWRYGRNLDKEPPEYRRRQELVARSTGYSRRSVSYALARLDELGLIRRKANGRQVEGEVRRVASSYEFLLEPDSPHGYRRPPICATVAQRYTTSRNLDQRTTRKRAGSSSKVAPAGDWLLAEERRLGLA
jgi:DNA-binding transcriptional ArsR family regulator